ncbi:hypothetical protein B0H66DRAFT_163613 [Apodospora peruviana]|uniref:Uncharacterized protein n=1 Tax=Apodospora peruviana TaxID=516989 RepID=A0AAE0MBX6_9PEZI|nr:hypothetical protein B0H66DRAFT_163613 [Apodospora peruviana]
MMAPKKRSRRQRAPLSTRSAEACPGDVLPLMSSNIEPGNNGETSGIGDNPGRLEESRLVWVRVIGERMQITQTYDPDTYDPDSRMPWTPEPEPYHPETYAAWGRKHYGDDWYEQRKTMLRERNIYHKGDGRDPTYVKRQRNLRILEHSIEGRPFEPSAGIFDKDWARMWAQMAKDLGVPTVESPENQDANSESEHSGYSTFPPTPSTREPTPIPDDPWERLEYDRKRFEWEEENYQFEKLFLKESLVDAVRIERENEEGDRLRKEKLEEIEKVKYLPGTMIKNAFEYERRLRHFELLGKGQTQEQIDADERAAEARRKEHLKEMERQERELPTTEQPRVSSLFGRLLQGHRDPDETKVEPQREPSPSPPPSPPTKNVKRKRVVSKPLPPDEESFKTPSTSHRVTKPRKTFTKERMSRRLARQPPEFGMLLGRGETRPVGVVPLRQPSAKRKTSNPGPRNAKKSRTPAKNAKPQGVSKAKKPGPGRPKKSAKASKG